MRISYWPPWLQHFRSHIQAAQSFHCSMATCDHHQQCSLSHSDKRSPAQHSQPIAHAQQHRSSPWQCCQLKPRYPVQEGHKIQGRDFNAQVHSLSTFQDKESGPSPQLFIQQWDKQTGHICSKKHPRISSVRRWPAIAFELHEATAEAVLKEKGYSDLVNSRRETVIFPSCNICSLSQWWKVLHNMNAASPP